MPISLSDYFAQRQPNPTAVAPPPAPTDADNNAAMDAANDLAARTAYTRASPFLGGIAAGYDQLGQGLTATHGLIQAALSSTPDDTANAVATLRRSQAIGQQAAQYTPQGAGSLSDAWQSGNLGTYAQYKLGNMIPGTAAAVAAGAVTGGIGGLAEGAAGRLIGGVATDAAEGAALPTAADAAAAAAGEAAPAASDATVAATKAAVEPSVTPGTIETPIPTEQSNVIGKHLGEFVGAGGAGAVQSAPGVVDDVVNDPGDGSTLAERAQKGLATSALTGAISAAPSLALLARYGLSGAATEAIAGQAPGMLARIAKNAGEQAAIGGASNAANVAVDRAAHAWMTGSPAATPALPDYINAVADGVLGGAVFGAPAGFKGEHSVSDAMQENTSTLASEIKSRFSKFGNGSAEGLKPGTPINDDGTPRATAGAQFDDALATVQDDPATHYDDLVKSTAPYNVKDDGTTATLNGPASGLVNPEYMTSRAPQYDVLFDSPTEKTVASMLNDDQFTAQAVPGIKAVASAITDGWSSLSAKDKNTASSFIKTTLDPEQQSKLTRVLATVDKMDPDTKARVDFAKAGPDLASGEEAPNDTTGLTEQEQPQGLGYVDDDTYKNAQFFQKKGGPARSTPDNENVRLTKGDGAPVDFNLKQAASSVTQTPEGRALLQGMGDRKLTAILAVQAEALDRGHVIDPASITAGKRVFPGEGGTLSPNEAAIARAAMTKQAKAHAPVEETPGRAAPTNDALGMPADAQAKSADGVNEMNGDIAGIADKQNNALGAELNQKPTDARQIENTAIRAADRLGLQTQKPDGQGSRNVTELYEDALHMGDNGNTRLIKSATRQLAETDPTVAQRMGEADDRYQMSRLAGERVTGDNGAQIPYLKALADGRPVTDAQHSAYANIEDRTNGFENASDKQAVYADALQKRIDAQPGKETPVASAVRDPDLAGPVAEGNLKYDDKVPLAEQSVPNGSLRDSVEAIQKMPAWKAIGKALDDLKSLPRTAASHLKESATLSALAKAFGTSEPTLSAHTGDVPAMIMPKGADGKVIISLNKNLKGAARVSAMMHEFGHHIVNEKFEAATPEQKAAIFAGYKAWRVAQRGAADNLETRLSKAPLFSGLRLIDDMRGASAKTRGQLTDAQAKYLLSAHEYLADSVARALEQHTGAQTIVGKFMQSVAKATKLAYDLVRGVDPRLTDSPAAVRDWVHSLYEAPAKPDADHAPPASASGAAPRSGSSTPDDLSAALNPRDRGILYSILQRRDMMQQLLVGADHDTAEALGNSATQMQTAINEGFKKWVAGDLNLTDKSLLGPLTRLRDAVMTATGIATKNELAERIFQDAQVGRTDAATSVVRTVESERQQALRDAGATTQAAIRHALFTTAEFAHLKVAPAAGKFLASMDERLRATNIPAAHVLASLVHRQTGERGEGQPMLQARAQKRAQLWERATNIINSIPEKDQPAVLDALRSQTTLADPVMEQHRQNVLGYFKDIKSYMDSKGVVMGHIEDYFPVSMDQKEVQNRATEFNAMLSDPKLEDGMRDYFKSKGWDTSDMSHMDMINKMREMAASHPDYTLGGRSFADTGAAPGGSEFKTRVSEFIYKQNDPELNKQFASFQTKDLEQLMIPYASHATNVAEFTNALGKTSDMKTSTFDQLLTQAREQGATDAHIQTMKDYVDAAMGSYGTGPNPYFAKAIGTFDKMFGTKLGDINSAQWQKASQAIIAYQNLRVLGLGLFGNMIDPLGVWTRSSSMKNTWEGYKGAYKAMMSKNPTYLSDMAHSLGTVESRAASEALAYNYGASNEDNVKSWSYRINRALFKVNGMESMTHFARLAATEGANKFLLQHAQTPGPHSARYLAELGIKPEDIKEDPTHPGYVQRNAAVDKALYQFVDESVLRPVPTQKPGWHSDPHFAIASQYKGYLYAFYATITERMIHEVKNGNLQGVAPVAGYLAVSMAAELARELVQFGGAGNPNRQNWTAEDYLKLAASRSGLAGPKLDTGLGSLEDVARGNVPLSAVAGPSISQAQQLGRTVIGEQPVKNTLIESLPGQSLYHGYFEDKDHGGR